MIMQGIRIKASKKVPFETFYASFAPSNFASWINIYIASFISSR